MHIYNAAILLTLLVLVVGGLGLASFLRWRDSVPAGQRGSAVLKAAPAAAMFVVMVVALSMIITVIPAVIAAVVIYRLFWHRSERVK